MNLITTILVNNANPSVASVAAQLVKQPPSLVVITAPTPPSPVDAPPIAEAPTQTPLGQSPESAPAPLATPVVKSWEDCIPLCYVRCKLHLRKVECMTQCMTCCDRCQCVPPGTYGNREKCGKCYTDMRTFLDEIMCP
ncbi:gibberellin-regulated protein 14 [Medicago truncatula]|uniref:gibberellin-regulated protein 14 n=1 Tax=Medicago truncatula TaxID=3880 RepID=UPI00196886BF|nr:gibberellin-regulated protein 14 [Medicago truncatula]